MEPATVRPDPTEPKTGDMVLHCGHVLTTKKHAFFAKDGIKYRRPDGSMHTAQWVLCCPLCFDMAGGDPAKLKIKGDGQWDGRARRN